MKNWKKVVAAAATALALVASTAPNAHAITGGAADGSLHPAVGILVFYDEADGSRYRCTATLVTPTVLLTAAHCTAGTLGKSIVNFGTTIAEAAPSNLPRAIDDTAAGGNPSTTGFEGSGTLTDGVGRTWYLGTAHADPDYSNFTDLRNWNDVGVVVLDNRSRASPRPRSRPSARSTPSARTTSASRCSRSSATAPRSGRRTRARRSPRPCRTRCSAGTRTPRARS